MKVTIIFLVVIFQINDVGGISLHKSTERLTWVDGMTACGSGYRSLTTADVPLSDKAWSEIQFENNERLWIGEYYKTTPFYWTTGELSSSIPDPVSQTKLTNNSLEDCAIYCTGRNNVNSIALKGDCCYCLGQKFASGSTYPRIKNLKSTCGAEDEKKLNIYTKMPDTSIQSGIPNVSGKHCMSLLARKNEDRSFKPSFCYKKKKALCDSGSSVDTVVQNKKDWKGAKKAFESRGWRLTKISLASPMIPSQLRRQYWIGLRRFSRKIAIGNINDLDTVPASCVAVERRSSLIRLVTIDCKSELKYLCLIDQKAEKILTNTTSPTMRKGRTSDNAEDEKITDTTCTFNQGVAWIIVGRLSFILLIIFGIFLLYQIRRHQTNRSMTTSRTRNDVDRRAMQASEHLDILGRRQIRPLQVHLLRTPNTKEVKLHHLNDEHPAQINPAFDNHSVQSPSIEEAIVIVQYDNIQMNADLAQSTTPKKTERQSAALDHEYTSVVDKEECTSTQTYEETIIHGPDHVYSSLRLK